MNQPLVFWISDCIVICVDFQVEDQLIRRLSFAIVSWTLCLKGVAADGSMDTIDTTPIRGQQSQHNLGGTPTLQVRYCDHVVVITLYLSQVVFYGDPLP